MSSSSDEVQSPPQRQLPDRKGKRPMQHSPISSKNSQSPATKKATKALTIHSPFPYKGITFSKRANEAKEKFRRQLFVDDDSRGKSNSGSAAFERTEEGVEKLLKGLDEKISKVDKLLDKMVDKFGGEETMKAKVLEMEGKTLTELAQEDWEESVLTISVRSSDDDTDRGVIYQITLDESFEFVYADYSGLLDTDPSKIYLMKGRVTIHPHDSARDVGLEDGDELKVHGVDWALNTNTNVKQIRITDMSNGVPKSLKSTYPLDEKIDDLYWAYALYTGYDLTKMRLVYNMQVLERHENLTRYEVRNGSEMGCFLVDNAAIQPGAPIV